MICKNCGKEIDDDSLFCECCGAKNYDENKIEKAEPKTQGKKKGKRIIKSILSIIIVVVLAYASRFFIFDIATNCILDLTDEANLNSINLNDSYLAADLDDSYLKPLLLSLVDVEAYLYIYTDYTEDANCYVYQDLDKINKSSVWFETAFSPSFWDDGEQKMYYDKGFKLADGEVYRVKLEVVAEPKFSQNQLINELDSYFNFSGGIGGGVEANFLYENGEFIRVNE